jgi:crotonobetainyl-CoA:carnitine CoA-transferase CaiB-like acyl-CoA transferase
VVVNPLLRELLPVLGLEETYAVAHLDLSAGGHLPAALPVATLAAGSVAAAGLAGAAFVGADRVRVDPRQVAVSFRGDQVLTVDGEHESGFAPLSGYFRASNGWVRTHANYPHHRDRLLRALGLPDRVTREDVAAAVASRPAQEVEDVVTADHGIAVRVRRVAEWMASDQARAVDDHPVLAVDRVEAPGGAEPGVLQRRPRILDLTRVIAGPVATRALAFLGADVLRVDNPHLPELEAQHLDTDSGKRTTVVDLTNPRARHRVHELLAEADVVVTGYRPGALAAYHLDAESVAAQHPHVVHASLSAWTPSGPWGSRRGFDSIVQAATGIAMIESADDERPGALPAQALDHATGYLLAAGITAALRRRAEEGGTWRVSAHLARTAHWLLRSDALDPPGGAVADVEPWTWTADTESGRLRQARPAFQLDDGAREFAWSGRLFGADQPAWL